MGPAYSMHGGLGCRSQFALALHANIISGYGFHLLLVAFNERLSPHSPFTGQQVEA